MTKWYQPRTWFIGLIRLYQRHISAHTPSVCRFAPTCSHYAIEALERHGAFFGTLLTLWRLLRCNPLFRGGYDPVPKRLFYKKGNK